MSRRPGSAVVRAYALYCRRCQRVRWDVGVVEATDSVTAAVQLQKGQISHENAFHPDQRVSDVEVLIVRPARPLRSK